MFYKKINCFLKIETKHTTYTGISSITPSAFRSNTGPIITFKELLEFASQFGINVNINSFQW